MAGFSHNVLRGRCSCGACGFDAVGPSALNFFSHSSAPRAASGRPVLAAAGFKPEQIAWRGEALVNSVDSPELMPAVSCCSWCCC